MKTLVFCALTLGIASSAFGAACASSTSLSTFLVPATSSCTFTSGGQTYTLGDFTYLNVGLLSPSANANDFTVSESTSASGPVVIIRPDSNLAISGIASETFMFGFDITANNPSINFSEVTLGEQSVLTGLATGIIAEEDCFGGLLPVPSNLLSLGNGGLACTTGGLSVGASVGLTSGVNANATVGIADTGAPTNSVDVLKEISLTSVLLGSAQVTGVGQGFATTTATTPEPSSLFLGGCGLVGLGFLRRNRKRRIS